IDASGPREESPILRQERRSAGGEKRNGEREGAKSRTNHGHMRLLLERVVVRLASTDATFTDVKSNACAAHRGGEIDPAVPRLSSCNCRWCLSFSRGAGELAERWKAARRPPAWTF